jgi:hypothetical protein
MASMMTRGLLAAAASAIGALATPAAAHPGHYSYDYSHYRGHTHGHHHHYGHRHRYYGRYHEHYGYGHRHRYYGLTTTTPIDTVTTITVAITTTIITVTRAGPVHSRSTWAGIARAPPLLLQAPTTVC